VDKVTKGGQLPAVSMVPPMPGYTPAKGNAFNPKAAQDLLAKAGYPGGKGFPKLTVIYNTNEQHKKIGEYIQQEWKKTLGIEIELQNQEWKTFLDNRKKHDFQVARAGWIGDYMDPSTFLFELLLSNASNNDGAFNNKKYDDLANKAAVMPDGKPRFDLLKQAEEIAITQEQAVAPIYFYVSQNLIDIGKWNGWYKNPLNIHHYKFIFKKR
jgi:oligopeptide transport system substrate-binding protein